MHPVIRIATFLILAVFLSHNNPENIITAAIILLLLFFISPSTDSIKQASKIIYRLRWLFLSIVFIYGWFSTGELLFPQWPALSPYGQGILHGLTRIIALIILIMSLTLLVLQLSRQDLLSSISWYCYPLNWLGISRQRVVARLILTIDAVQELQLKWQEKNVQESNERSKLQQIYQRVLQLFDDVVTTADQTETTVLSITLLTKPAWYQWLIPLSLTLVFWFI